MPQKPRGSLPYFKFYAADWLSSATISGLPVACEGGYIRLLCYCWSDRNCSLPDDEKQLLDMARFGPDDPHLEAFKQLLSFAFQKHPDVDGRRTNLKLYEQHLALVSVSKKRAQAGAKGGAVKSNVNGKQKLSKRVSKTEAKHKQTVSVSTSPSSSRSKKKKGTRGRAKRLELPSELEPIREDLETWITKRKLDSDQTKRFVKRCAKFVAEKGTVEELADGIDLSLMSKWTGLNCLQPWYEKRTNDGRRHDPKSAAAIAANVAKYQNTGDDHEH